MELYICNSSCKLVVLINGFYKEQKVEFSHAVGPGFYRGFSFLYQIREDYAITRASSFL
jgi:hypothetical protein